MFFLAWLKVLRVWIGQSKGIKNRENIGVYVGFFAKNVFRASKACFTAEDAAISQSNVNEPGSLAQVATVIAEHDGNIDNISMSRRSPDFTELTIDLEVYDLKHLNGIIALCIAFFTR